MKKFEKPGASKFQTMERNQMDQAKGGGRGTGLGDERGSYRKTTVGFQTSPDYDFAFQ